MDIVSEQDLTLVTRKACFGLPTAGLSCLPVYIYLKFSQIPFNLTFNIIDPDSDQLPYVESGVYAAYNNEKGGVIEGLKEDGILDLDSGLHGIPEWLSMKAMVTSWLADALLYELWLVSDGNSGYKIYYSDLPFPIGKILFFKQIYAIKQLLGITKENAARRETEIYTRAANAYGALSTKLGEEEFFFENRPTSLDALFLGHVLLLLQALPESSVLRTKLLEFSNLVKYAEALKTRFVDSQSSSSVPLPYSESSSSAARRGTSKWNSKAKNRTKREKTEEEKKFKRKAKYFLAAQLVSVLVFLSIFGGSNDAEVEFDDDPDAYD